jgi:DNA-directed RNA polymerase alpha subunit
MREDYSIVELIARLDTVLAALREVLTAQKNINPYSPAVKDMLTSLHHAMSELCNRQAVLEDTMRSLGRRVMLSMEEPPKSLYPIVDIGMSSRLARCLKKENITYLGEVARLSKAELLRIPNFGRVTLHELETLLAERGLKLHDAIQGGQNRP